jgi:drug/metabolite transporter (DMT)-like permease
MKQTHWGHIAIIAVNLIFGFNTPITKSVLGSEFSISPLALTFLRFIGASLVFWIAAFLFKAPKASKKDVLIMIAASFLGIALNQMSFVTGLSSTSPVDASIVVTLTPVLTMIAAAIFLREPITVLKAVGVFIGCAGALLLILTSASVGNEERSWSGNLFCLMSCIAYALYLTLFKNLIQRNHPLTLMKWMFLFGSIMVFPLCYKPLCEVPFAQLPLEMWGKIAYIILAATFLTYLLIPVAQVRIRPTTLSMYNYLQPIVTTLVAVYMGMGTFGWQKALAAGLIFAGVYVVTQSKSRKQLEMEKNKTAFESQQNEVSEN